MRARGRAPSQGEAVSGVGCEAGDRSGERERKQLGVVRSRVEAVVEEHEERHEARQVECRAAKRWRAHHRHRCGLVRLPRRRQRRSVGIRGASGGAPREERAVGNAPPHGGGRWVEHPSGGVALGGG